MIPMWGRLSNLRRIVNPPCAGPGKIRGCRSQSGIDGVRLNEVRNVCKLRIVANQPIVAFVLPKRLAGTPRDSVALQSSESFERLHNFGDFNTRRHQKVNVVRHDHECMELIMPLIPIVNGVCHHFGDFGDFQVARTCGSTVQNSVHSNKSLSRWNCRRKTAVAGQTAFQSPGYEQGLTHRINVWQSPVPEGGHRMYVSSARKILNSPTRPIGNRPQVGNLPHVKGEVGLLEGVTT